MTTYTQIIYQIVFATKRREKTLSADKRQELFAYIATVIRNKKCFTYCVNGVEDHLHIVCDLHPSVSLAALVKDIKLSSTHFIKEQKLFKKFNGWQSGYGAFTYTVNEKERLIRYVENQENHHKKKNSLDELNDLLIAHQIEFYEKYFS